MSSKTKPVVKDTGKGTASMWSKGTAIISPLLPRSSRSQPKVPPPSSLRKEMTQDIKQRGITSTGTSIKKIDGAISKVKPIIHLRRPQTLSDHRVSVTNDIPVKTLHSETSDRNSNLRASISTHDGRESNIVSTFSVLPVHDEFTSPPASPTMSDVRSEEELSMADEATTIEMLERSNTVKDVLLEEDKKQIQELKDFGRITEDKLKDEKKRADCKELEILEQKRRLESELESKDRQLEEKDRQLDEVKRQLEEAKRQLGEKSRQMEERDRKIEEKSREIEEGKRQLDEKDRQSSELKRQLEEKKGELGETRGELKEARRYIAELKEEVKMDARKKTEQPSVHEIVRHSSYEKISPEETKVTSLSSSSSSSSSSSNSSWISSSPLLLNVLSSSSSSSFDSFTAEERAYTQYYGEEFKLESLDNIEKMFAYFLLGRGHSRLIGSYVNLAGSNGYIRSLYLKHHPRALALARASYATNLLTGSPAPTAEKCIPPFGNRLVATQETVMNILDKFLPLRGMVLMHYGTYSIIESATTFINI